MTKLSRPCFGSAVADERSLEAMRDDAGQRKGDTMRLTVALALRRTLL
jgi:hypothetical protein